MPTVRTKFRPDLEIEVGDVEYAQLKAEGLLFEETPAPEIPAAPLLPEKKTPSTAKPN